MKCYGELCPYGVVLCCSDCDLKKALKCTPCSNNKRKCQNYERNIKKAQEKNYIKALLYILAFMIIVAIFSVKDAYQTHQEIKERQIKEPARTADSFNHIK